MLGGFEISANIQDEGFESGRIQQEGHRCFSGFELFVGYCDHGVCPFCVCSDSVNDIHSVDRFGIHKLIDVETVMNRSNII